MVKILPDSLDNPFESNPFPDGYLPNNHEDKLFKHVVFQSEEDVSKLRVTAVGHDWTASTESTQKVVDLLVTSWDSSRDKIRIKAVMDTPVDGVDQSHWVQQKYLDKEVQVVNQFRARGVSKKGWKSKWVYSELRDQENELVAFELLHDLLDVLLYTHDHDLEAVLDSAVKDTFANYLHHQSKKEASIAFLYDFEDSKKTQIQELLQTKGREQEAFDLLIQAGIDEASIMELQKGYLQPNESKRAKVNELTQMVSHLLRKEFHEMMHSSPMALADLAKTYKLFDRFQTHNTDFAYLIMESFLDDKYEEVIEEINLGALLSNDEEMHSLLQSVYEFDVQSELIKHAWDLGLDDHFVTVLNDAVKLISEPIVFENLKLHATEETAKFLRIAFQEVFVPFLLMEKRLLEVNTDLSDELTEKPVDRLLEFITIHENENSEEDYIIRHLILEEMFDMIMTDIDLDDDYHFELLDRVINMVDKERIALFIDYDPVEFIEIFSKISEDFNHEYKKFNGSANEQSTVQLSEDISVEGMVRYSNPDERVQFDAKEYVGTQSLKGMRSLRETLQTKARELQVIMSLLEKSVNKENMKVSSTEEMDSKDLKEPVPYQDTYQFSSKDNVMLQSKTNHVRQEVIKRIALQMELLSKDTTLYAFNSESKNTGKHDLYEYVYNLNPLDRLLKVYLEFKEQHLDVDRLDNFFEIMWNMKDQVTVYLGELGGAWPVGKFVLGSSTLKGDSNSEQKL